MLVEEIRSFRSAVTGLDPSTSEFQRALLQLPRVIDALKTPSNETFLYALETLQHVFHRLSRDGLMRAEGEEESAKKGKEGREKVVAWLREQVARLREVLKGQLGEGQGMRGRWAMAGLFKTLRMEQTANEFPLQRYQELLRHVLDAAAGKKKTETGESLANGKAKSAKSKGAKAKGVGEREGETDVVLLETVADVLLRYADLRLWFWRLGARWLRQGRRPTAPGRFDALVRLSVRIRMLDDAVGDWEYLLDDSQADEDEGEEEHGKVEAEERDSESESEGDSEGESEKVQGSKKQVFEKRVSVHRNAFSRFWLSLLQVPHLHPQRHLRPILQFLISPASPSRPAVLVLDQFYNPRLLHDFFVGCFDYGGSLSLLSLEALFPLMTRYGLDVPSFFPRLYDVVTGGQDLDCDPQHEDDVGQTRSTKETTKTGEKTNTSVSIMHSKYRDRLFRLLQTIFADGGKNVCLVPATLVVRFVRAVARLVLLGPPGSQAWFLAFLYNVMRSSSHGARVIELIHEGTRTRPPKQTRFRCMKW